MLKYKNILRKIVIVMGATSLILMFAAFIYTQNNERIIYSFKKKGVLKKVRVLKKEKQGYLLFYSYSIKTKCVDNEEEIIVHRFLNQKTFDECKQDSNINILYHPTRKEAILTLSLEKKNLSLIDKKTSFHILFIFGFLCLIVYLKT